MTRSDAFRQLSDIANHHLIPLVRTGNVEYNHRVFVENFMRQLFDTINTALKNPNSSQYKIEYETDYGVDDDWDLSIKVGESPAQPNSHHIFFNIQGEKDIRLSLSKTDTWYDNIRKSSSQHESIGFVVDPEDRHTHLYLKATRKGQQLRERPEWVFNYVNGQPRHEDCTYRDYL